MPPKATEEDYKAVQGGKPKVKTENGLTVVTHDYEGGEGMEVKSHVNHGTVTLQTADGPKEFEVDLLKGLHGEPCERESKRVGGEGYPRVR